MLFDFRVTFFNTINEFKCLKFELSYHIVFAREQHLAYQIVVKFGGNK